MKFVFAFVIIAALLALPSASIAKRLPNDGTVLWITLCSGGLIALDIGRSDVTSQGDPTTPPQNPVSHKACHVLSCQRGAKLKDVIEKANVL